MISWRLGMQDAVLTLVGTGPALRLREERGLNHGKHQEAILASLLIRSIVSTSA